MAISPTETVTEGLDQTHRPSVGLERGTVFLTEHKKTWAHVFARQSAILEALIRPHIGVLEHVGSTAVPGLIAKPIVDIALGLSPAISIEEVCLPLVQARYLDRGNFGRDGGVRLFIGTDDWNRSIVHVHVLSTSDRKWMLYRDFKEVLTACPVLRAEYVNLKRRLAMLYPNNRRAYTAGKAKFIDKIHEKAGSLKLETLAIEREEMIKSS